MFAILICIGLPARVLFLASPNISRLRVSKGKGKRNRRIQSELYLFAYGVFNIHIVGTYYTFCNIVFAERLKIGNFLTLYSTSCLYKFVQNWIVFIRAVLDKQRNVCSLIKT